MVHAPVTLYVELFDQMEIRLNQRTADLRDVVDHLVELAPLYRTIVMTNHGMFLEIICKLREAQHKSNILGQRKYIYSKIKRILE